KDSRSGRFTANLSSWGDGTVSAVLSVTDPANNSFTTSTSVAIDPDFNEHVTLTGPTNTLGSVSASVVTFTVSGLDNETTTDTGTLVLTEGTSFSTTINVSGNGSYTANLTSAGHTTALPLLTN